MLAIFIFCKKTAFLQKKSAKRNVPLFADTTNVLLPPPTAISV